MDYEDEINTQQKKLLKLKYYCQMCNRQCHDENGFICHQKSATHKRKMELFISDPNRFIENFSKEFEYNFLDLIQSKYPNISVLANKVYQDYISEQLHIHLNSTKWPTLDSFVKHLAESGKCIVDTDPVKGTFLKVINKTPDIVISQIKEEKKQETEKKELKRQSDEISKVIEMANKLKKADAKASCSEIKKVNEGEVANEKVEFQIKKRNLIQATPALLNETSDKIDVKEAKLLQNKRKGEDFEEVLKREKANDVINKEEEREKRATNSKVTKNTTQKNKEKEEEEVEESWIQEGLIVKLKDKSLANSTYLNKKARIVRVKTSFIAELQLKENNHKVLMDQAYLEPVIPQVGGVVKILSGEYKANQGIIEAINIKSKIVTVKLSNQASKEISISFKNICKYESD